MDYSVFKPFSSSSYFHSYCLISNYDNQSNVEDCWLGDTTVSLPDLDTTQTSVQTLWYDWIADLVSNYSSTSNFHTMKLISDQLSRWAPCRYREACTKVILARLQRRCRRLRCRRDIWWWSSLYLRLPKLHRWRIELSDVSSSFSFGLKTYWLFSYYQLLYAFESSSGSISDLYNMINTVASDCADSTLLGNFIENHDNPRFAR